MLESYGCFSQNYNINTNKTLEESGMSHQKRVVPVILFVLSVLIPLAAQSQNLPGYTLISNGTAMTFIPRPDLGYVIQSDEKESSSQAFQGMLSSIEAVESRKVKGLNKRNLTVLMNSDETANSLSSFLQSQVQTGYKAPLYAVNNQTVAVIPEIVVKIAFESAYKNLESLCKTYNLSIKQKLEFTQREYLLEVHGLSADSVFNAVEALKQEVFVEWAFPNIASQPMLETVSPEDINEPEDSNEIERIIPNDEYFTNLWHLYNTGQTGGTAGADVNATKAWKVTTGDPNIIIAVLDSGVDINHPDLYKNIVPGYDFVDDDNVPTPSLINPYDAHGTLCAGLAAAKGNNLIGVSGVAWNCKIMPVKIADDDEFIADSDIATAFRWAATNGADVLSNSWGGYYSSQILYSAISDVTKKNGIGREGKGCIVCVAAGNWQYGGPIFYPAAYPEVIAVGATDHDDQVWYYSASGPELDIVAPSGAATRVDHFFLGKPYLWTTDIQGLNGYSIENLDTTILDYSDTMSGTSGACPLVAGAAALVLSVDPNLTNIEVRNVLLSSTHDLGEPGKDYYYGFGKVDVNAAVHMALNPLEIPQTSDIILFVDNDAPDDPCVNNPDFSDPNEDGTSQHPFDSIQKAIDYALSNETIVVLSGTYTGNGNRDIDLLGKNVKLISEDGPKTCVIDCQYTGQGFILINGEPDGTVIDGFTIKNAKAFYGAGIYCTNGSSPTISNCIISNCLAFSWGYLDGGLGGGLYIESSSGIVLENCVFEDNMASLTGGGICNLLGNITCNNCSFINNGCGDSGGAIFNLSASSINLTNCLFSNNYSDYEAGAIYFEDSIASIDNCTFNSNLSYYGNAISCDYYYGEGYGNNIEISNSIIWDGIDSIDNYDSSNITISYSDVQKFGSSAWQGTGNIKKNPEFANPDNSDYHLKSETGRWDPITKEWIIDNITSPCIDAGNPTSDIGNEPDPNGNRINMGFYGGTSEASMSPQSGEEPLQGTKATTPTPSNNAYYDNQIVTLSWAAGTNVVKHDVYLGTDSNSVKNATRNNSLGVLKSQAQENTSYSAGILNNFTIYYWRIDEVLADDTIIKGDLWTFIVYAENTKGRSCFTAETPVWVNDQMVEISKVVAGQTIGKHGCSMSISGTIKELEVHSAGINACYKLTMESGNTITIVHSHYFMTVSGEWKKIEELSAGMKLQSMNGPITIKNIEKEEAPFLGLSYNLVLNNSEQYLVGRDGIVALDCSKKTWEILENTHK